jgi:hypothetical protein
MSLKEEEVNYDIFVLFCRSFNGGAYEVIYVNFVLTKHLPEIKQSKYILQYTEVLYLTFLKYCFLI